MQVEQWPVDRLLPYASNARTHPEEQVAQIAASIQAFGFNVPCLVDEHGVLVAGHGRVLAAQRLGLADVPVIRLRHLTKAQVRAFRIADNKIALGSGWDDALLAAELAGLQLEGVDLSLTGFDSKELDDLLAPEPGGDEEETPEPPANPVTRAGDVWLLGGHRVMCGDSTDTAAVARLLGQERPNLMVTDPPYGVDYDPAWRARAGVNLNAGKLGRVENDDRADWREAWALFPGNVAYVWHADTHRVTVEASLLAVGFAPRATIIWAKDRFALGRGDYHWQHEPCLYVVRAKAKGQWEGDRSQSTLWEIPAREDSGFGHGTQKPVECMRRPIINNSKRGGIVYDPFLGSGTTVIAAEGTDRRCFGMELSPQYCDVIIQRWADFTGEVPVREDGAPWPGLHDRGEPRTSGTAALEGYEGQPPLHNRSKEAAAGGD